MTPRRFWFVVVGVLVGASVAWLLHRGLLADTLGRAVLTGLVFAVVLRLLKFPAARQSAMWRRIGWRYGYGAGYVDARRGRDYDNTPPDDGRTRATSEAP